MGNYKIFSNQEEDVYSYDEMKSVFDKKAMDNMLEEKRKEYLRDINLKYQKERQERLEKIEKTRKKAVAIAISVFIAAGAVAIAYNDHVMKERFPSITADDMSSVEDSYSYDDFIDYCHYITEVTGAHFAPSQEHYQEVVLSGELKKFIQERDNGGKKL
jgi:hypothetical protein